MVLVGVATCSVPPIPSLSGRDDRGSSELSSLLHRGGRGDYTGKGNTRTLVYAFSKHWFTTPSRLSFSSAAATLSLSLSCLLIASSEACAPGEMRMSTLRRGGSERSSLTRKQRPMSVAMEQCGIVGVKRTTTRPPSSSTSMSRRCATLSCSSVCGCSGSLIPRISSAGGGGDVGRRRTKGCVGGLRSDRKSRASRFGPAHSGPPQWRTRLPISARRSQRGARATRSAPPASAARFTRDEG
mmetsp:Transcript_13994/g.45325  ORF Transcript_13994/g.45325 Transcript_13994/m.45325 type:complete len:241 (-) Transcript_13994:91-813(-)